MAQSFRPMWVFVGQHWVGIWFARNKWRYAVLFARTKQPSASCWPTVCSGTVCSGQLSLLPSAGREVSSNILATSLHASAGVQLFAVSASWQLRSGTRCRLPPHLKDIILPTFCDVCRQRGGVEMALMHISTSGAHSNKILSATPMFSGSSFLVMVLPISWDVVF